MEAQAVIPAKSNKIFIPHDTELYKQRNRIERCFERLTIGASNPHDRRTITPPLHTSPAAMIWLR